MKTAGAASPAQAPRPRISTGARSRRTVAVAETEGTMADNPRWTRRPEGSTWGDFGPDDEKGRLNLLTPKRCCKASPR